MGVFTYHTTEGNAKLKVDPTTRLISIFKDGHLVISVGLASMFDSLVDAFIELDVPFDEPTGLGRRKFNAWQARLSDILWMEAYNEQTKETKKEEKGNGNPT